jgi:hypothetical protein
MNDATPEDNEKDASYRVGQLVGVVLLIVLAVAVVWFVVTWRFDDVGRGARDGLQDLGASDTAPKPSGGWLDRLLGADAMVGFLRLVVVGIGIWVLASTVRHVVKKNWIASFTTSGISTVNQQTLNDAVEARNELKNATAQIDVLTAGIEELEDQVADSDAETAYASRWVRTLMAALDAAGVEIPPPPPVDAAAEDSEDVDGAG